MTLFKEETMLVHPVAVPGSGTRSWTVLGDDDVPVGPVDQVVPAATNAILNDPRKNADEIRVLAFTATTLAAYHLVSCACQ